LFTPFYKKTVMKILLSAFLVMALVLNVKAQKIVNDPNAEPRQVGSFKAIHVGSSFHVIITQGSTEGLAVSAIDKEEVARIKTVVENGVLKISYDHKNKWWHKDRKLKAYISVKDLVEFKGSGASEIKIDGSLSAENLSLELSGASDLEGKVFVSGKFDVELTGASDLDISGNARDMQIEASGASKMKAFDFTASTCNAKASGASSIRLTVEKELSAKLTGASSLRYDGAAVIKDIHTSGASSIAKR
jgi:hypothetical protein